MFSLSHSKKNLLVGYVPKVRAHQSSPANAPEASCGVQAVNSNGHEEWHLATKTPGRKGGKRCATRCANYLRPGTSINPFGTAHVTAWVFSCFFQLFWTTFSRSWLYCFLVRDVRKNTAQGKWIAEPSTHVGLRKADQDYFGAAQVARKVPFCACRQLMTS